MSFDFKKMVEDDVHNVFLNIEEFSDIHTINGEEIPGQVDSYEQIEREKRYKDHMDGLYMNKQLLYVSKSDFGKIPKEGSILNLDGNPRFRVIEAVEEDRVYVITIGENRS